MLNRRNDLNFVRRQGAPLFPAKVGEFCTLLRPGGARIFEGWRAIHGQNSRPFVFGNVFSIAAAGGKPWVAKGLRLVKYALQKSIERLVICKLAIRRQGARKA